MRVLLTSNATHDPPRGGSTRSNLVWLRHLASRGHECVAVAPTPDGAADRTTHRHGITIHGVRELSFHAARLGAHIREVQPDWVLVSSEDVSHVLLREASKAAPGRIVYLAHTPQFFPFGPESWNPDDSGAAAVRNARAVVAIGSHMAGYIRAHLGREATVIHPPIYGHPPYAKLGQFGSGFVLMINPCAVKGLPVFLELARRFPTIKFAALNGWGTTASDREALAGLPNTSLLMNVPDIEEVLAGARVLLMPSLWYEGFGLIAMEAMLRGVPVIASDSGGLREAMQDGGYVVPVRPVERYEPVFDDTLMPRAVIPPQPIEPWATALRELIEDESAYWMESRRAAERAAAFVSRLDAADFEKMLLSLKSTASSGRDQSLAERIRRLNPEKRAQLAARLKQKREPA